MQSQGILVLEVKGSKGLGEEGGLQRLSLPSGIPGPHLASDIIAEFLLL